MQFHHPGSYPYPSHKQQHRCQGYIPTASQFNTFGQEYIPTTSQFNKVGQGYVPASPQFNQVQNAEFLIEGLCHVKSKNFCNDEYLKCFYKILGFEWRDLFVIRK